MNNIRVEPYKLDNNYLIIKNKSN